VSFNIPARVVLSNRTGGGTIFGDFEFFQSQTLGNNFNLRGYRNYRFSGRSSLYNNTEVRLKLFDFDSYLIPGTLGLIGFFDIGRVWYADEDSKLWHKGYGGGIYFSPAGRAIFTLTYGFSKEDQLPDFSLGFKF
jgi:hemolysin activation/secretion protein